MLGRAVPPNPTSGTSLATAQSWLTECLERHRICGVTDSKQKTLPTRVIDVGPTDLTQNPRLLVTQGEKGSWAALSYCWGGNSSIVLNSTNIDQFRNGEFSTTDYPATLIDAVYIARALKIRYLWIDALCILQDSPDDWAKESARMKEVYGGAILTIAATRSDSTEVGMLRERSISTEACMIEWKSAKTTSSSNVFLRSTSNFWDTTMKDEPINQRGWTLQESLLSPRTLSYGSQQMAWECQECKTSESGRPILAGERHRDKGFIQSLLTNRPNIGKRTARGSLRLLGQFIPCGWSFLFYHWEGAYDEFYSRWFAIVREFCRRDLTVQSDVFPALSGIAATFQNILQDRYCAGLWRYDMIRGLVWTRWTARALVKSQRARSQPVISRPANHRIPSWSWASITGGQIVFIIGKEYTWSSVWVEEAAKVIDCHTSPSTTDPFGHTLGGHIILHAPFLQVNDPRSKNFDSRIMRLPALHERIQRHMSTEASQAEFEQQHQGYAGQDFALIRVVKCYSKIETPTGKDERRSPVAYMLILESTGDQKMEYRRLGLLTIRLVDYSPPDDNDRLCLDEMNKEKWEWKKVRLV